MLIEDIGEDNIGVALEVVANMDNIWIQVI